ncbi:MAG: nucleoside-diphosphate kinase [Elusimicrobiota bacterium]
MAIERTLVLIKPDGAKRKLTGLVIDRLDAAGLTMVGAKVTTVTEELAREHYKELKDKPFFEDLIKYIRGKYHDIPNSRILALVYEGEDAVKLTRKVAGATHPEDAEPHTLRGSFGRVSRADQIENVLHASGTLPEAQREIDLWFAKEEVPAA